MSEGQMLQSFNINELAGATGLILGAVGGLLAIIWKSRCHCKFRIGCSDKCSICMCERKPPPDPNDSDDESKKKQDKSSKKDLKKQKKEEADIESLIPPPLSRNNSKENSPKLEIDISETKDLM